MNNKKQVAIITMHRIKNFGSALQAWALQESINKIGHEAIIIDYLYPNAYYFSKVQKKQSNKTSIIKKVRLRKLLNFIKFKFLYKHKKQNELFLNFWNKHFIVTSKYSSPEELKKYPPIADVYMTGSDQVWNPNTMYGDPAFFLDFGNESICRISFAASFGTNTITEEYKNLYSKYLSKYQYLSIRENTGVNIVKSLIGKECPLVCDPTLLLTQQDYQTLAKDSEIKIKRPYLLAYILDYAYNPRPAIDELISQVSKLLGLHIVYLVCGNINGYKIGSTTISAAGPNEFIRLFSDAKFVITSSFHGTVFSLIHQKPFFSVLPSTKKDNRIASLLAEVGLQNRGVHSNQIISLSKEDLQFEYKSVNDKLSKLRENSMSFLHNSLNNLSSSG